MVKFVRRDFHCWGDIRKPRQERCIDIVKAIAEMITGSGTGWEYDERTPHETFIYVASRNDQYQYPITYLVNSVSGAKMMITAMCGDDPQTYGANYCPKIGSVNYLYSQRAIQYLTNLSYSVGQVGISISMIPSGSTSNYPSELPNDATVKFIPNDALPLVSESYDSNTSWDNRWCALGCLEQNSILSYGILVDSEFVMIMSSYSNTAARSQLYPKFAIGKLIGTLANNADDGYMSNYGAIVFENRISNQLTYNYEVNGSLRLFGYPIFRTRSSDISDESYQYATFFGADGTLIKTKCSYSPTSYQLLTSRLSNDETSGHVRWCPFTVQVLDNSATEGYYVVPGDGFKGYLDTNLFRNAVCTKGNFYNNGQFVGMDNNLIVAWDSEATDTIM